MKRALTLILGFVLLAVMAVGGYFLVKELNKEQAPDDTSAAGTRTTCPNGLALKQGECYTRDGKWKLTWNDEFTSSKIDAKKWYSADWKYPASDQLQYYTPSDAYIQNDKLVIRSQKRKLSGYDYSSGWVSTSVINKQTLVKNLYTQKYGKIEVYAQLPYGKGIWPAFWLMPNNAWPPEIDIMEMLGQEPNKIYMTNHWKGTDGSHQSKQFTYTGSALATKYHEYSIEWDSEKIIWLIDGKQVGKSVSGVPNTDMYLIINTAIGGWAGEPDSSTVFPQYMYIDYVRFFIDDATSSDIVQPATCTSFIYSDWGACSNGTQSRTVKTSSPSDCSGGSPVLSQSCTNNTGGTTSTDNNVSSGTVVCTNFTYTSWSSCINGRQTRSVKTSIPAGCVGGSPVIGQSCTSDSTMDSATNNTSGDDNAGNTGSGSSSNVTTSQTGAQSDSVDESSTDRTDNSKFSLKEKKIIGYMLAGDALIGCVAASAFLIKILRKSDKNNKKSLL